MTKHDETGSAKTARGTQVEAVMAAAERARQPLAGRLFGFESGTRGSPRHEAAFRA